MRDVCLPLEANERKDACTILQIDELREALRHAAAQAQGAHRAEVRTVDVCEVVEVAGCLDERIHECVTQAYTDLLCLGALLQPNARPFVSQAATDSSPAAAAAAAAGGVTAGSGLRSGDASLSTAHADDSVLTLQQKHATALQRLQVRRVAARAARASRCIRPRVCVGAFRRRWTSE